MFNPKVFKTGLGIYSKSILIALVLVLASGVWSYSLASNYTRETILRQTNRERALRGRKPLNENELLDRAALAKAQDMIANNQFEHFYNNKTPWQFISEQGYDYKYAGENLAMDFERSDAMMRAWMASPSHRANMLGKKYVDIGIAVVDGNLEGHQTTLVVQMFGREKGAILGAHTNPIIKFLARIFGF